MLQIDGELATEGKNKAMGNSKDSTPLHDIILVLKS